MENTSAQNSGPTPAGLCNGGDFETRPTTRPPSVQGRSFTPKTLGMPKIITIFLDDERMAQWTVDADFRRGLLENLADEFPSADRIMIRTYTNAEVTTFVPETYLEETTLEYVRTDEVSEVPPVLDPDGRHSIPPLTRTIRIPGAGMRVPNRGRQIEKSGK